MGNSIWLITAEKPSVGRDFANAIIDKVQKHDGYLEGYSSMFGVHIIITWTLGHLVTLSYPEVYDEAFKKWDLDILPFLPEEYKYEVINDPGVKKQFGIIKKLLNGQCPDPENYSSDMVSNKKFALPIQAIYNAGDSGREGEYIQRLVYEMAKVNNINKIKRIWIDSQTDSEIIRGIKEARDEEWYNKLSDAAYMRAIEDYAMGINFSRALTCKYGKKFNSEIKSEKYKSINVGRVMTCVLGMVVERERQIRDFRETPFYRIEADCGSFTASWKAAEGSRFENSPLLYNDTGFAKREDADSLLKEFLSDPKLNVLEIERKEEKKMAPLLFNLAELQSECSRIHKISPDDTLNIAQKLYEYKLTTYPRTDARVITTSVAQEIDSNLKGLVSLAYHGNFAEDILKTGKYKGIEKTKYTDDSKVTDHYAIIPTGQGSISGLSDLEMSVYHMIVDRFLSIFMPPAVYAKTSLCLAHSNKEKFYTSSSKLIQLGYFEVTGSPEDKGTVIPDGLKANDTINANFSVKEGKTQPPKRYTSGSMILAMENAGNLIEEEELREQIKGSGIGTSATRAGTIKKLVSIGYLELNKKTQVIKPHPDGEAIYDIVSEVLSDFLSPKMTASWERGLSQIEQGKVTKNDYNNKLNQYIKTRIQEIKNINNGEIFAGKEFEKVKVGTCPLCGADVMTSKTGSYICSRYKKDDPAGCRYGVPRKLMNVELKDEQMKKLLNGEKTDLIEGLKNKDGKTFSAYLSLENGNLKFDFPKAEDTPGLGKCPNCGCKVVSGSYGAYCTGKCGMSFGKAMGKSLSENQVKALLENRSITLKGLKSKKDASKKYDVILTPDGLEDYSYTNKNGDIVKGKQFKFSVDFPKSKKKP